MNDAAPSNGSRASFTGAQKLRILGGILFCSFLGSIDHSIVAPALPAIGSELDATTALSWVVTAYLLASTVGIPLFGKLSDTIGRSPTVLIAISGFVAGSLACALASDLYVLIASRAFQGLFGGALQALGHIVISDVLTPKERGKYQGYITTMFVVAGFMGPVLGGFLSEFATWRLIFWINVPLGLAAIAINRNTLRSLPKRSGSGRMDVIGLVLVSVGTVPLVLALSVGGVDIPWLSLEIAALLFLAALLWTLFVWRILSTPYPFISPRVLSNPVIALSFGATALSVGIAAGVVIYLPLYYQNVLGFSASQAGLALVCMSMGTVVGSFTSGQLMARVTRYRLPTVVGLLMTATAAFIIALAQGELSSVQSLMLNATMGLGIGTFYPFSTTTVQNAASADARGATLGGLSFVRAVSQSIFIAGFGAIVLSSPQPSCEPEACAASAGYAFSLLYLLASAGFALAAFLVFRMREVPLRDTLDM